jgi:hypothetical protein
MERREVYGYSEALKSFADERDAEAQLKDGRMLYSGEDLFQNNSLAVDSCTWSARGIMV